MLTIRSAVKNLFMTDGVHKNFRVHFPNGEMSDITNENVVRESVKFTESLCSQGTFKFGLAEASVLEFETVGIGNMYGMTIEAGIEIDLTSLSGSNLINVKNNPYDGSIYYIDNGGKNRFPYGAWVGTSIVRGTAEWNYNGVKLTATEDSCYTDFVSGTYPTAARIPVTVGVPITVSWETTDNYSGVVMVLPNGQGDGLVYVNNNTAHKVTYTPTSGITFVTVSFGVANTGNTIRYKNIQIEQGSNATSYEPAAIKPYYHVPYGTFKVDSCPRDHQAMTHRKVVAYSLNKVSKLPVSPYEEFKLSAETRQTTYRPNIKRLVFSTLGYKDESVLTTNGYTKTLKATGNNFIGDSSRGTTKNLVVSGTTRIFHFSRYVRTQGFNDSGSSADPSKDALYAVKIGAYNRNTVIDGMIAYLQNTGVDYAASGYSSYRAIVDDVISQLNIDPWIRLESNIVGNYYNSKEMIITGDVKCLYPYRENLMAYVELPYKMTMDATWGGHTYADEIDMSAYLPNSAVYEYIDSDSSILTTLSLTVNATLQRTATYGSNTVTVYTFINAFSYLNMVSGYLELICRFLLMGRKGTYRFLGLSSSSLVAIQPADYSECWWDEYDIDNVGVVTVTYKDGEQENTTDITIGSGSSRYDMTNNEMLKELSLDLGTLTTLINSSFTPNVQTVKFTPIELNMQGWPWLEAGDALQITAEDNTVVNSYALRMEVSGIQYLTAMITADGGQIIEEVS